MDNFTLSDADLNFLIGALTVAAEVYDKDAVTMHDGNQFGLEREFANMANQARSLAERIENR